MAPPRWKKPALLAIKTGVGLLVLWAVGRHVARTWRDLQQHGETLRIDPGWVALAVVLYLLGLSAYGVFFGRVLKASATPVGTLPALRAYLISHLGKYVPGKALVVVMRVGLVVPFGARPATAAFATLYETLLMMAAGGLLAGVGFAVPPAQLWAIAVGLGLGLAFLVVVWPTVFPRISAFLSVPFPHVGPDALPRLSGRLLGQGLLWSLAGWTLLGLSQVAVIEALGMARLPVGRWPVVIASVALATVAGFVIAVLPGGLGVREGVLMATLKPALGEDAAVVAALTLRLVWVVGEGLAAAVLAVIRPSLAASPPSPLPGTAEP
jgi:uncharacterized membrane protein YbhN (UPF0104 family)